MGEISETTTTGRTSWWSGLITWQTIVGLGFAFVSLVTFWNNQKNQAAAIDALSIQLSKFIEKQKIDTDKSAADIEEALDWKKQQQGYQQAIQDVSNGLLPGLGKLSK